MEGVLDIVRKPAEGLRRQGARGLVKGIGTGLAGTIVKPVVGVSDAVSDIIAGISSTAASESEAKRRRRARQRKRLPRLLFGPLGAIRRWNEKEAELLAQVGSDVISGLVEPVLLASEDANHVFLLLFEDMVIVAGITDAAQRLSTQITPSIFPGDLRPRDLFQREFANVLRPIDDILKRRFGRASCFARGLRFTDLHSASVETCSSNETSNLILQDSAGARSLLRVESKYLGASAEGLLLAGLNSAAGGGQADWAVFGAEMRAELRNSDIVLDKKGGGLGLRSSTRELVVFEVERFERIRRKWGTPFLPADKKQLSWRWVDDKGRRHCRIRKGLTRKESARCAEPPCELSSYFQPVGAWSVDVNERTDDEGWTYSIAWKRSGWSSKPGLLDDVRRRRWVRSHI
eukprot:TRINITY_DN6652_c1_g1_i1.p1 TRINITY_DN6652_c1_g1~~TRINITY_DN6652_c1_g1_i1.p1  ORF type:complete len:433 (+),score=49.01 TRINITY_DN6652_c1_g1_i1:89-1300(+)